MKKRLLLMLVMMFCLLALGIRIAPAEEITVSAPAPKVQSYNGGLDSSSASDGFIRRAFGLETQKRQLLRSSRLLPGHNQFMYERLAEVVRKVATGELGSTICTIPLSEFKIQTSYPISELEKDNSEGGIGNAFYARVKAEMGLDFSLIYSKLRSNLPFDMYWASNTFWDGGTFPGALSDGINIFFESDAIFTYSLIVSPEYSTTGENMTSDFNTSLAESVQTAASNAKAIVSRYANTSSDLAMLRAYKDEICSLVSYNRDAAAGTVSNKNAWQAVWVFDGNEDTNVVCEGYSKAFQYLCDMSSFRQGTSSSIVSGTMKDLDDEDGGPHMWNLVTMNGLTYLADITNCDVGSIGYPDKLFMSGYNETCSISEGNGYVYLSNGHRIAYIFDEDTLNLYSAEELAVTDSVFAWIDASAKSIQLGESITLTISIPGMDELHIWCEKDGSGNWMNEQGSMSVGLEELVYNFTPTDAGSYVFYAGYYDEIQDLPIKTTASIGVTVFSNESVSLLNEELNIYFDAEAAVIDKTIDQISLAGTDGLTGVPEWSVTQAAGTAQVTVTGNGKTALLSVVSFPNTEEEAVYTVACVWGNQKWDKKYTVHFLDLSGKQTPRTRLAADGLFWVAKTGDPLDLQNCFTVVSDWTPVEGDSVRIEAELSADNEAFFTLNSNTRTLTPNTPGRYELDLKLALNNVSWIESHTLYVSRQNGTVPAESYQSVGSDMLELPADLTRIESEAFRGSPAEIVIIPKGCTEIGSLAFADMPNLKEITIPSSVNIIGEKVFDDSGSFAVYANSEAAVEAALGYPGLLVLTE